MPKFLCEDSVDAYREYINEEDYLRFEDSDDFIPKFPPFKFVHYGTGILFTLDKDVANGFLHSVSAKTGFSKIKGKFGLSKILIRAHHLKSYTKAVAAFIACQEGDLFNSHVEEEKDEEGKGEIRRAKSFSVQIQKRPPLEPVKQLLKDKVKNIRDLEHMSHSSALNLLMTATFDNPLQPKLYESLRVCNKHRRAFDLM